MLKFTCCDALAQFSSTLGAHGLRGITRGFEKECLRVGAHGVLSAAPHPLALGSKLTHPWITTDYSEALLEFITPPSQDPAFGLQFLRDLHRHTAQELGDEMMWAGSMPCALGDDKDIPLADYGRSNKAQFKHVYREGLGLRYGRHMQTIAGVHFNWSLPDAFWAALYQCCNAAGSRQDFVSERYFGLIRNFMRYSWLIPYLFGASPAVDASFVQGRKTDLLPLGEHTLYGPYATSLRMSDLGYQNRVQSNLQISFNAFPEYTRGLDAAIHTADPFYQALGVNENDHWKQLNANILQIENEFYAGIRPKRIGKQGERPAVALQKYGVEYVEVRLFDLNPLIDIGIAPEQGHFADVFLLMCLLRDSPPITSREHSENDENKRRVVSRGRQPDLHLLVHNREQAFAPLAHELFDDMLPFAQALDTSYGGAVYANTMQMLRTRIDAPETTPSAMVLEGTCQHGSWVGYAQHLSRQHHEALRSQSLAADLRDQLAARAAASLAEHAALEAQPQGNFADYVRAYYA
jgi:glutamate--cysteine ligase